MVLSTIVLEEIAKEGMIALPGAPLLIGILLLMSALAALVVLLVLGFDFNLLMFKVFRRVGGVYLVKVLSDDTIDFEFRKNWDSSQNEINFTSKGKDLTITKPLRLDLKLSKRHRKYGVPVVLAVEGQATNADWKLGIVENESSQLNAISKMRAHALGVLEGMLANMWDHRWVMIAAIAAIIAIIIAGVGVYQGMKTAEAVQAVSGALTSVRPDILAIKSLVGAQGTGIIAPGG